MESPSRTVAEWSSSLNAGDVPERTARRAGWQWASVIGSIFAGANHPHSQALGAAARRTGGSGPATVLPEVDVATVETAVWVNAGRSVLLDFDDYLFAGHTGHSAVLVTLALGEALGSSGPDMLAATVAANEAGGRLGASMLLGPHNGQMWAYIHNIGGAVAAARLLGLDEGRTFDAIGLALTQPPYPLAATFMGSDGKALTASGPALDGLRGALLAAEGMRCEVDVLSDSGGFFAKINENAMPGMFSGFGTAWLTDSLSYKVYPGCAYLDTAVDAAHALLPLDAGRVTSGRIKASLLTTGMEMMSAPYRRPGQLREINLNFSAAYSVALTLLAGRLTPAELDPAWWQPRVAEIDALAERISVDFDGAMNAGMGSPPDAGFSVLDAISRGKTEPVLDGASFVDYQSRFPATLELELDDGSVLSECVEVPLGGSGRPEEETRALVRDKLEGNGAAPGSFDALEDLASLGSAADVRKVLCG